MAPNGQSAGDTVDSRLSRRSLLLERLHSKSHCSFSSSQTGRHRYIPWYFTEAPLRIVRVPIVVGTSTIATSPALDIAALYLSSWPAAIFTQPVISDALPATSCQLTGSSRVYNDSPLARSMSLHHGVTGLRDKHLTCYTTMLYSSMTPGNLPSQLDILSTGQTYYQPWYL